MIPCNTVYMLQRFEGRCLHLQARGIYTEAEGNKILRNVETYPPAYTYFYIKEGNLNIHCHEKLWSQFEIVNFCLFSFGLICLVSTHTHEKSVQFIQIQTHCTCI
jgi:hypothetical protein